MLVCTAIESLPLRLVIVVICAHQSRNIDGVPSKSRQISYFAEEKKENWKGEKKEPNGGNEKEPRTIEAQRVNERVRHSQRREWALLELDKVR